MRMLDDIEPSSTKRQYDWVPINNNARILVHQICHNEVHATLTEAELAREFNTPEALREHEKLAAFFRRVARKPPGFYRRSVGGRRKR